MLLMSWMLALIAFGAVGFLFLRLRDERAAAQRLRNERMQLAEEIEQLKTAKSQLLQVHSLSVAGQMAGVVAREIEMPLNSALSQLKGVGKQLDAYRVLVKAYDAAVQYCLQPVEMIFGADKAGLDQLVKHVEEARRQLFSARVQLEKSPLLTESKTLIADALQGLGRSAPLVDGLRKLTRTDREGLDAVDINACLDSALTLAAPAWGERITILREYTELPCVNCMPAQINRAFLHILDNAAAAIEGRGTITVQTRAGGTRNVEIRFSDTGPGIDEEVLAEIFEPFFSTRSDALGLGLSNAHAIVKAHGGSINVRTAQGSGTTIVVSLPIMAATTATTASAPAVAALR